MSWLNRFLSKRPPPNAATPAAVSAPKAPSWLEPIAVESVGQGLDVRVYSDQISSLQGPIACWVYVSAGLLAHGQREILFALRREPREKAADFPKEIARFVALLKDMAAAGDTVDSGEVTQFSEAGLFAGSAHRALTYIPLQPVGRIPLPERGLLALLITQDELEVVKAFGSYRLSTRLGKGASHFPTPPWSERRRASVVTPAEMARSPLQLVSRLILRGSMAGHLGNTLRLEIAKKVQSGLASQLRQLIESETVAFLTDPDPAASGRLVFESDQTAPEAISPPEGGGTGSLTGGFVLFRPDRDYDGAAIVEDGYELSLRPESWLGLRKSLLEGKDWAVSARGRGMNFQLDWAGSPG